MAMRSHAVNLEQKEADCDRQYYAKHINTVKNISQHETASVVSIYYSSCSQPHSCTKGWQLFFRFQEK
jgi:hypothetical protein